MFDAKFRPLVDRSLNSLGSALARRGLTANTITGIALVTGLSAAVSVAMQLFSLAVVLIALNRILDGLDGAVARASSATDRGGYLDIVADYVFYASIPLAFAFADPIQNALAATALLAGFCLTASTFLAFATIAAKRGLDTETHGRKSFYYSTGLVEGSETIMFFLLMALVPGWFPVLAWIFAGLCILTSVQRTILAWNTF